MTDTQINKRTPPRKPQPREPISTEGVPEQTDAPAARRLDPAFGRPIRATWSFRLTRWQMIRLQLGIGLVIVGLRPDMPRTVIAAGLTLMLLAVPWPAVGVRNQPSWRRQRLAESPLEPKWLNPIDHVLPDLEVEEVSGRAGDGLAVASDQSCLVTAMRITELDGSAPDSLRREQLVELLNVLCDRHGDDTTLQVVVTMRDIPVAAVALDIERWVDPNGNQVRPVGGQDPFACLRCWVVIRYDNSSSALPHGDSSPCGTANGHLRRVTLTVADVVSSVGLEARPNTPQRFREMLEISSAGPELDYTASGSTDQTPESNDPSAWRFGDRWHVSYEIRSCSRPKISELLDVIGQSPTAAAVASFVTTPQEGPQVVVPRRAGTSCIFRLTFVDPDAIDATCAHMEELLDDAEIRWHRLDGWHRESYLCSLPLGRSLPAGRPRLALNSVVGRRWRDHHRSLVAEHHSRESANAAD